MSSSPAEIHLGAAPATSSATLTLLTPRQRVAKLLEAVGLGHYKPEAIAELHVRDNFGGRPPKPDQLADVRRFEELMWLAHGIEMYGLDVPLYSSHRPIFDVLTIEEIEELLLLHPMIQRLVREAKRRIAAVAEQPVKYDMRPGAMSANWETAASRSRGHDRRPGCNARTRGSRRTTAPTRGSPDEPPGEHLGHHLLAGRRR
jgi:hypothetical protein